MIPMTVSLQACDYEQQIDPNNNLYNDISVSCSYYTDEQFNCDAAINESFQFYISMLEVSKRTFLKSKTALAH